jgi:2-polyprenyl-3-methyl-5-hydroxy-6-metoxy-1,4-benzoquinol methylase
MNNPDIFGLAFNDYLTGNTTEKITVGIDIGEPEELPVSYFFRSFKEMPGYEKKVLKACKGRVLDVGAGAGSHALWLQGKGLDVTAVDVSPGGVDCMKQRGVSKAVCSDIFDIKNEKFDTILFLMNGIGMAETIKNLSKLLKHAASLLDINGRIYLESTDLLYMYEEDDGSVLINLAGKYYGEIMYQLSYKNTVGKPFPWLFVDFPNLEKAALLAGLKCEMFFQGKSSNYIAKLYHDK